MLLHPKPLNPVPTPSWNLHPLLHPKPLISSPTVEPTPPVGALTPSYTPTSRPTLVKGDYTCTFTYASQGGTNEQWQMSIGVSEDNKLFSCSVWRPQGKSYLFFTQFKAEVKGAKIEYGMAYSQAATGGQSDIPLKAEEFEITETTVAHKEGKFRSELSKLLIVAKTPHDEL
ncbi:myeloid-derived growth factor isoform X1 [Gopherus flavomarginatus]|uniref:myeloid-derived growth factor isoform X1 n=1 Tax=Gopherus flavomarginatus TaxID=286002 RepID=UPI0021CBA440|nr:myeloid-derived growth factor isoform X1 [Gopherus flavomarginatus]